MPNLSISLQMGGQRAKVTANFLNALELAAPTIGAISWQALNVQNGGSTTVEPDVPSSGNICIIAAANPGTCSVRISGTSLSNVNITYDIDITVTPAPVNEGTHFAPTFEMID